MNNQELIERLSKVAILYNNHESDVYNSDFVIRDLLREARDKIMLLSENLERTQKWLDRFQSVAAKLFLDSHRSTQLYLEMEMAKYVD